MRGTAFNFAIIAPFPDHTTETATHGKNLAGQLRKRRGTRDRHRTLPIGGGRIQTKRRTICRQTRLSQHGRRNQLPPNRQAGGRFRILSAKRAQAAARRAGGGDDAQSAAIPDCGIRHPAGRAGGGQYQPALHPARTRTPAQRQRRHRHRGAGKLCQYAGNGAAAHPGQTRYRCQRR